MKTLDKPKKFVDGLIKLGTLDIDTEYNKKYWNEVNIQKRFVNEYTKEISLLDNLLRKEFYFFKKIKILRQLNSLNGITEEQVEG